MLKRPLNKKEIAILTAVAEAPDGKLTLAEMAKRFRRADNKAMANSWARNSVRRPTRLGLLKKSDRGTYSITAKGKAELAKNAEPAKAAA